MQTILYEQNKLLKDEYLHKKSGRRFRRIVAGIGWPGIRPGFVSVLGLEVSYRPPYHIYLIAEAEIEYTEKLLVRCTELKADCRVSNFYSSIDKQNSYILSMFNKKQKEQLKKPLLIEGTYFSEDGSIGYHINQLLHCLDANNKTLHFSLLPNSKLPSYLHEIQSSEVHQAKAKDFPAIAALGFAVSALTDLELLEDKSYEQDERNNIYDPLDY